MITDYIKLSIGHLKRKKLRSSLTILGIFISITTIFVLISLSLGLNAAVKEQFRTLGTDKLIISPKVLLGPPGSSSSLGAQLTLDDSDFIEKINGVKSVTYYAVGNAEIRLNDEKRFRIIFAFPPDKMGVYVEDIVKVEEGRLFKKSDTGKILVGTNFKHNNIFGKPVKLGDKLFINNKPFEVICIRKPVGNPQDDNEIDMTYKDFQELFDSKDRVDGIMVQIKQGEDLEKVAENIKNKLMDKRKVTKKTIDFEISTPEELLSSFQTVLNIITVFLIGVATVSLIVGSIGISNTMYTSVIERTKEIGTMKAIGARNLDIIIIFVSEAGILGLFGGLIGVVVGIGIGKIIEFIAINYIKTNLLATATPLWLILSCLTFAFIIGTISGLLPSLQASKIKPADTLRYE
jgi:putative ABC transport system permease protein